jgi:[ribosomal protein S5]-alanine N-acetyltransferase
MEISSIRKLVSRLIRQQKEAYRQNMVIDTKNLRLISCDIEILKAAIERNEILARRINATIQDNWTEFGVDALKYSLDKLKKSEKENDWWTYFAIHIEENKLIGSGGYKGKPTAEGKVELGYEIAPEYRNRGLATEMAEGLIDNALRDKSVKTIIAHTLGLENPSTKVLKKCGFQKVEEINDPDDGLIWKWEITKAQIASL